LNLKLSEWANAAEIIGAAAIVVSLIYVGIQVDDSTRAVRSAAANDTASALSAWYAQLGTNAQASTVFLNAMTNPDSLSREELFQFVVQMHGLMMEYQAAYYLSQEGTLDEELQESITATLLGVRDMPGFAIYWQQRRGLFKPTYRDYVENLIATGTTNKEMEQVYRPRGSE